MEEMDRNIMRAMLGMLGIPVQDMLMLEMFILAMACSHVR
jgi:hypothetical protein